MSGCGGCLVGLTAGTILMIAMPFAAIPISEHLHDQVWEVASLDQGKLSLETTGGSYAWYESATFGTAFELVSSEGDAIALTADHQDLQTRHGRTFAQFAETELAAGSYELRFTPSPYANDEALVGYGASPEVIAQRRSQAAGLGFLAGLGLAVALGVVVVKF